MFSGARKPVQFKGMHSTRDVKEPAKHVGWWPDSWYPAWQEKSHASPCSSVPSGGHVPEAALGGGKLPKQGSGAHSADAGGYSELTFVPEIRASVETTRPASQDGWSPTIV